MKNLVPVFAGIALVAGIVSATMWSDLRAERQLTADLREQLAQAKSQPAAVASLPQTSAAPPVATTPARPEAESKPVPVPAVATPANDTARMLEDSRNRERELMKDPDYRKARLAQQRLSLQRSYPGLVEELGLTEREAERLFDLLAENQIRMNNEMTVLTSATAQDQARMQEMARQQQAMQKEQEDAVRAMLGESKYSQWQAYQQTRSPRMQATSIGSQLAQAGFPLTDTQQRSLTSLLISEQQRQRQETQAMARNVNPNDPLSQVQMMEDSLKRQEERNRRVLEAASSSLNSQQVAALRQQYETQMTMNRAQMRMERARIESQGPQAPGQAAAPVIMQAPVMIFP